LLALQKEIKIMDKKDRHFDDFFLFHVVQTFGIDTLLIYEEKICRIHHKKGTIILLGKIYN
jgi:hypothetical protein